MFECQWRDPVLPPSTSQPRIRPLEPPYPPGVEAALRAMMPRNAPVEPLRLFRTFVHAPVMADAMTALGRFVLGRELALDLHDRELVVHRVCARCRCEYEWGVHAASFAPRAGLSAEPLGATVTARPRLRASRRPPARAAGPPGAARRGRAGVERPRRVLVRLVEELHDTATVAD